MTFTIECSGNTGLPFFWGGIGNATWAGTPLAPLLQEAGVLDEGREVVFYGHDIRQAEGPRRWSVSDAVRPQHVGRGRDEPEQPARYEMNGAAAATPATAPRCG